MIHLLVMLKASLLWLLILTSLGGCTGNSRLVPAENVPAENAGNGKSHVWTALRTKPFESVTPDESAIPANEPGRPPAPLFTRMLPERTGITFRHQWNPDPQFRMQLNSYACMAGVAIGDYDGDGRPDVFLANQTNGGRLYRNLGAFRFQDVTKSAGVWARGMWTTGVTFADIDNDRDLDLYLCGFASANRLYENQGNGTFVEKAAAYGLDYRGASAMISFADYDRDGDLDAYLLTNRMPPKSYQRGTARKVDGNIIVPTELREQTTAILLPDGQVRFAPAGQFDYFFRNNGDRTFSDVTDEVGVGARAYQGLSATWWDHNADGWPDLYVSNDLTGPDHFYEHNADPQSPGFVDRTRHAVPHVPWFSMGSDIGDINNDGMLDLITTDMAPTTHYRSKLTMGDMSNYAWFLDGAEPRQYMRNALLLNTGTGRFLEAAQMAGVASTDWTWSVRMADFDCDGRLDLLMTTGMSRDFENTDASLEVQRLQAGIPPAKLAELRRVAFEYWRDKPARKEANVAFRNVGDLRFEPVGAVWGIDDVDVSSGCATGDLDGDGDEDLVVNNFTQPASVYRNESRRHANRVKIELRGKSSNAYGIGSTVELETPSGRQIRYLTLARGYLSSSEPAAYFGVGDESEMKRLTVHWASGQTDVFQNLAVNKTYTVFESQDGIRENRKTAHAPLPLFIQSEMMRGIRHQEAEFDDFARQPLLPNRLSQLGPGLAWGDLDGDGTDDVFIGGAAGEIGRPYFARRDQFAIKTKWLAVFAEDAACEDMGILLFDVDLDGDLDVYVVSGGVECEPGSERLRDRIYLNDGRGLFRRAPATALPDLRDSGGSVCTADFDRDGDLDLFIGGRVVPGAYPTAPQSRLLRNDTSDDEVAFTDVTNALAAELATSGMVTGALWSDIDADGWLDLLVTQEWGPVKLFRNQRGKLIDVTESAGLAGRSGWFNGIASADVDRDGDLDYVVTNFGQNTKYHASIQHPVHIYYGDFDGTGRMRIIEATEKEGRLLPVRGKSCSQQAMPFLESKFPSYHEFALQDLTDLYSDQRLQEATRLEVTELDSGLLINDGDGHFSWSALPRLAQIAPSFGVVTCDFNGDGYVDIALAQNFFGPQRETGRMDGGVGLLLTGNASGTFMPLWPKASGFIVPEDAMALTISDLNQDGSPDLVASTNNGTVKAFTNTRDASRFLRVRLHGPRSNRNGVGARIVVETHSGERLVSEVYAGGSYLSQSPAMTYFGLADADSAQSATVHWPDGKVSHVNVANAGVVRVDYDKP